MELTTWDPCRGPDEVVSRYSPFFRTGQLRITGGRATEQKAKGENEIRIERFHGPFSRTFALPDNADAANIRAGQSNGSLTVHIPKTRAAKPAKIDGPIR